MEAIELAIQSDKGRPLPLPKCVPTNVMVTIEQEHSVLTVYDTCLPGLGSHRASIEFGGSGSCCCIARPFQCADEARRIYGLLIRCKHPNILQPLGLWVCDSKKNEVTVQQKSGAKVIKAFISFPIFDGSLIDVPRQDIFLVEDEIAYGVTCQGSRILSDIFSAVNYINELYDYPSNTSTIAFPLSQLRFNNRRIVYIRLSENEYKVLLWADFFPENYKPRKEKKGSETIDEIRLKNWAVVTGYMESLSGRVQTNGELQHLVEMLKDKLPELEEKARYNEILWQPGLWNTSTKIHFIREVFWSFNKKTDREQILKAKVSLGLKDVIAKLRFSNPDKNLYDSIAFLRNKIVAHQDSSYESYDGVKDEVGTDKQGILAFIQKINPICIINLVNEIRQLHWISHSPLLRSENAYMAQVGINQN